MKNFIVLVDKLSDWHPYFQSEHLVTVQDYLFSKDFQSPHIRVINLSKKMKYLSLGYYCTIIGEARSHKMLPSLKTISDLSKKKFYYNDLEELQKYTTEILKNSQVFDSETNQISFRIYFSHTQIKDLRKLALEIFAYYPSPILEVNLCLDSVWQISSITPLGLGDLSSEEEDFFATSLEKYSNRIWRLPKKHKDYIYDFAVLVNPAEKLAPSDSKALQKFKEACDRQSVYCEFIEKKDRVRINEFDALFIRETTSINNHTYSFARIAKTEGLVVIDDSESILKCTNKIYISNLMDRIGLQNIPGKFVHAINEDNLSALEKEFGYPMIIKIPDGSFSIGVNKAENREELIDNLTSFLKKSDLVLVQKFLYTKFDWRVGVLDGKGLYACKYFMSADHWQIYNHEKEQANEDFSGDSLTLPISDIPPMVLDTAVKAASSIGKGLYGVDLKEDEHGNVYVVEINDNPNIDHDIEDAVLGEELYDRLVSWFISQIEKKAANISNKKTL